MIARIAVESDIEGILKLQSLNLYANLSASERADGFVMTCFTAEQIAMLLDRTGVFVIEKQGMVAGYILAGSWDFFSQWPIFPYMVSRFPPIDYRGTIITENNTFQYGPICLDRTLRGSQAFPLLFATMRSSFAARFPIGITFINKLNSRSFTAHTKKLNMEVIDEFEFNGNSFYSLGFLTQE
jgi:hypothetical protein